MNVPHVNCAYLPFTYREWSRRMMKAHVTLMRIEEALANGDASEKECDDLYERRERIEEWMRNSRPSVLPAKA